MVAFGTCVMTSRMGLRQLNVLLVLASSDVKRHSGLISHKPPTANWCVFDALLLACVDMMVLTLVEVKVCSWSVPGILVADTGVPHHGKPTK